MSLIHEALQKAEIERRAGELPSLLSAARLQPTRNTSLVLPLLLFAGVLIVAAAAYNNRTLIGNSMPGKSVPTVDLVAPLATTVPGASESVALKPAAVRADSETKMPERATPLAVAMTKPVASAPATEPVTSTPPSEAVAGAKPTIEPMAAPPPIEPVAEIAIPEKPVAAIEPQREPPEPIAAASAPTTATSTESTPYIFELPLETRQALPTLKVTMHVYSDDPGKRFAIIDGKRINEGGVVGNELDMVEIQRDALLMKFRNERFLMPRLGR